MVKLRRSDTRVALAAVALARTPSERFAISQSARALARLACVASIGDARDELRATGAVILVAHVRDSGGALIDGLLAEINQRAPRMPLLVVVTHGDALDVAELERMKLSQVVFVGEDDLTTQLERIMDGVPLFVRRLRAGQIAVQGLSPLAAPIVRFAFEHGDSPRTVPELGRAHGLSVGRLARRLERAGGLVPSELLAWAHLTAAAIHLECTTMSCGAIANELEFASASAFINQMQRYVDQTPNQLRSHGGSAYVLERFRSAFACGAM